MGGDEIANVANIALVIAVAVLAAVLLTLRSEYRSSLARRKSEQDAAAAAADDLQRRERLLDQREERLNRIETDLEAARSDLTTRMARLSHAEEDHLQALAGVAQLSVADARNELLAKVESDARLTAAQLSRQIEKSARKDAEKTARQVIVTSIQRLAAEQVGEASVAVVPLPSEEMKGRIIGREGRNIRAFEQVTGVNLLIDDTPGVVLLSCFDPLRLEIARLTLTDLIADGRIHPGRIEDAHEHVQANMDEVRQHAAEDALVEMGITELDPRLMEVLGACKFRTSYGQNVLAHLVESGHVAALMAAELGLDVALCKRAAFLHDIGKAISQDTETSHALAGAELARRCGESPEVVHAIEAHHNEVEPRTVEAVLVQAADAISGSRPGARRESLEAYVQRLQRLEEIAGAHPGVEKVFAIQAGREVRVMVVPEQVNDAEADALAQRIAKEVQDELTYPGSIRVTVVRESRATAVAH